MATLNKLKSLAFGVLITSSFTLGLQEESKSASLVIDNFNDPGNGDAGCSFESYAQCVYFNGVSPTLSNDSFGLPNAIGGTRSFSLAGSNLNGTNPATNGSDSNFGRDATQSVLRMSNAVGVNSIGTATYNANGAGLNFNPAGFNFINFSVLENDVGARVSLTLTDGNGTSETKSLDLANLVTGTFSFAISSFTTLFIGEIDAVSISVEGLQNDLDFQMDFIEFDTNPPGTPEPTSVISLIGVGVLGVASSKLKKKP